MKHTELTKIAEMPPKEQIWITFNKDGEKIDIDKDIKNILSPDEKKEIYDKINEWRISLNPSPPIRMRDPYFGVIFDDVRFVLEVFLSAWKENTSFVLFKKNEIN